MTHYLITGGAGFVGCNLARRLVANGHKVTVLDNFLTGSVSLLDGVDVTVIEGDIRDETTVTSALRGVDAVFHLAAAGSVIDSIAKPEDNFSSNAVGTFVVLQACRKARIEQVIFSSTGGAIMGNAPLPVTEKSVPRPISPYGASKLACEAYCSAFASAYGLNITALRFANVIGPHSLHKKGVLTAWSKALVKGEPIHIYGDGEASRDFLYVDDLCSGLILAADQAKESYATYHIASGKETTVNELKDMLLKVSAKQNHPVIHHSKRRGEVERNFASYELAKTELCYTPMHTLEESVRLTWEWTRDALLKS